MALGSRDLRTNYPGVLMQVALPPRRHSVPCLDNDGNDSAIAPDVIVELWKLGLHSASSLEEWTNADNPTRVLVVDGV